MKVAIKFSLVILIMFSTFAVFAQALITDQTEPPPVGPHESALLELRSDQGTMGFLPPHVLMIDNGGIPIPANDQFGTPAEGLIIYNPGGGDDPVDAGLWYFGGEGKWIVYSNPGSKYSTNVDNFGEIFQDDWDVGTGVTYFLSPGVWTYWVSGEKADDRISDQFLPNLPAYTTPVNPEGISANLEVNSDLITTAVYTVNASMVVQSVSSQVGFRAQLWIVRDGGAEEPIQGAFFKHYFQTGGEYATLSTSALITLNGGDHVEIRMTCVVADEEIIVEGVNLRLAKISGSN